MVPSKKAGLLTEEVDGLLVVLDPEREMVHQLNESASYLWNLIDGRHSAGSLATLLAQRFDVDAQTAEDDVAGILEKLRRSELVLDAEESS